MIDLDLVARVDELGARDYEGDAFRHVSPGTDPLSTIGSRLQGGRWNPPGLFGAIYFGLQVHTVAAEFRRAAGAQGLSADDFLPRELHRFHLTLSALLDLRDEKAAAHVGLPPPVLLGRDQGPCRLVGEAAQYLALEGVLAPSATGEGAVLALFVDRLRPTSVMEARGHEVWSMPPP